MLVVFVLFIQSYPSNKNDKMSEKRRASELDPDYEDLTAQRNKRQRLLEEDGRDITERKIQNIIRNQFSQELQNKESEIELIDQRLYQARSILDRLRACIIARYYCPPKESYTSLNKPNEVEPPSIHPAVKKFLGKTTKPPPGISTSASSSSVADSGVVSAGEEAREKEQGTEVERCSSANPAKSKKSKISADGGRGARFKVRKRIVIGNVSKYIPVDKREGNDQATHKWMVYVRGSRDEPHIDHFVKKVWFFLHPSYRPNDLVEIRHPPFHLTRRGWGEFPVRVQLHFYDSRNKKVDIIHHLKLDKTYTALQTLGGETVVDIEIEKASLEPRNTRQEKKSVPSSKPGSRVQSQTREDRSEFLPLGTDSTSLVMTPPKAVSSSSVGGSPSRVFATPTPPPPASPLSFQGLLTNRIFSSPDTSRKRKNSSGWTHLQIKNEPSSPIPQIINTTPPKRDTTSQFSIKLEKVSPQVSPQASLSSLSDSSSGWTHVQIKSEPASPSPSNRSLSPGWQSLSSMPSPAHGSRQLPERKTTPDGSTSLTFQIGNMGSASGAVQTTTSIAVATTQTSPKTSTSLSKPSVASAVIQDGRIVPISNAQNETLPSIPKQCLPQTLKTGSPRPGLHSNKTTAAASSPVYLKCVDNQGKIYLIPQHLLSKQTLSQTQSNNESKAVSTSKMATNLTSNGAKPSGSNSLPDVSPGNSIPRVSLGNPLPGSNPGLILQPSQPFLLGSNVQMLGKSNISPAPSVVLQQTAVKSMDKAVNNKMTPQQLLMHLKSDKSAKNLSLVSPGSQTVGKPSVIRLPTSKNTVLLTGGNASSTQANTVIKNDTVLLVPNAMSGKGSKADQGQVSLLASNTEKSAAFSLLSSGRGGAKSILLPVASCPSSTQLKTSHGQFPLQPVVKTSQMSLLFPAVSAANLTERLGSGDATSTVFSCPSTINSTSSSTQATSLLGNRKSLLVRPDLKKGPVLMKRERNTTLNTSNFRIRAANDTSVSYHSLSNELERAKATLQLKSALASDFHQMEPQLERTDEKMNGEKRLIVTSKQKTKKKLKEEMSREIRLNEYNNISELVNAIVIDYPIVDSNADRSKMPWCAHSKEEYLNWNVGKRRASEWCRAGAIQKKIMTLMEIQDPKQAFFKGEKLWSRKKITRWCRSHDYTILDKECRFKLTREVRPLQSSNIVIDSFTDASDLVEDLLKHLEEEEISQHPDIGNGRTRLPSDSSEDDIDIVHEVLPQLMGVKKEKADDSSTRIIIPPDNEGANELIQETALQVGVRLRPIEPSPVAAPGVYMSVIESMMIKIITSFMDEMLRESLSIIYQENRLPEEVTTADVHKAIMNLNKFDFLTNRYLGKKEENDDD